MTAHGLTSREIASQFGRPEAGIRNLRHRLGMKQRQRDNIKTLRNEKRELEDKISELKRTRSQLTHEIRSLEGRKGILENFLSFTETVANFKIRAKLIELKRQEPELFYLTGSDQIIRIADLILTNLNYLFGS